LTGSLYALDEKSEVVVAMYSLETLGFYSSEPGTQHYPPPFGMIFGNTGDFVAFVAISGSRELLDRDYSWPSENSTRASCDKSGSPPAPTRR
jgi:hypothetical protein